MFHVGIFLAILVGPVCGVSALQAADAADNGAAQESRAIDVTDVSDVVKAGQDMVTQERQQLQQAEKAAGEKTKSAEEKETQARQDAYQQKIVQEAENRRALTTVERQLQRERFRREIMAAGGREAVVPFKLKRRFAMRASQTYDDNVFLSKTEKKTDYITKISPSVLFSLSSKYIGLDANYVCDITRYQNSSGQGGMSHLLMTYIRPGSLKLPFLQHHGGKIGFEIQDDIQPLVTGIASSEQTQRTERTSNQLFMTADYYMSEKRTLALEYTNIYEQYRTSGMRAGSYMENVLSPTLYFHARPKWSLFGGYSYGSINYMDGGTNGSSFQAIRGGISGRLFTKVLAHFEAGEEWRQYKEASNGSAQKMFFKSTFFNRFTQATSASLEMKHTIEESLYMNNPYYLSDSFDLNIEHHVSYKTTATAGFTYTHNSYDKPVVDKGIEKKRADNIYCSDLGLKYYFRKWGSADLRYTYTLRTSNFTDLGYADNRITAGVNADF